MSLDALFHKRMQRIGEIVEYLEAKADPNTRAMGKELIESLMALHGTVLERILEFAANSGQAGQSVIKKCGEDDLVSSVLLLYGLHPEDLLSRVAKAIEKSRPYLESHSSRAELFSVSLDGVVTVRFEVKSSACCSTAALIKSGLEEALQEAAPDATTVVVEEIGSSHAGRGFVPVSALGEAKIENTMSTAPAHGTGG